MYEVADHAYSFNGGNVFESTPGFRLCLAVFDPNVLKLRDALTKYLGFLLKTKDSEMKVEVFRAYLCFDANKYDQDLIVKTVPKEIMQDLY